METQKKRYVVDYFTAKNIVSVSIVQLISRRVCAALYWCAAFFSVVWMKQSPLISRIDIQIRAKRILFSKSITQLVFGWHYRRSVGSHQILIETYATFSPFVFSEEFKDEEMVDAKSLDVRNFLQIFKSFFFCFLVEKNLSTELSRLSMNTGIHLFSFNKKSTSDIGSASFG